MLGGKFMKLMVLVKFSKFDESFLFFFIYSISSQFTCIMYYKDWLLSAATHKVHTHFFYYV